MLQSAATRRVVLEPQCAIEIRAVHLALLDEHIADAAGNLASDRDATVSIPHLALANHNVLRWCRYSATICVAAALDGYAIVTSVEEASLDENIAARFRITAIVVRPVGR